MQKSKPSPAGLAAARHNIIRLVRMLTPALMLLGVLVAVLPPALMDGAEWGGWIAKGLCILAVSSPFSLISAFPRAGGVPPAVTLAPGVDEATLNRCAAIAEYHTEHPLGVRLREYCGDVGCAPEKHAETPGYGVTARFSGQIIHAGSHEYLTKLGVEVPEAEGTLIYLSLDGKFLGHYRFEGGDGKLLGVAAVNLFCAALVKSAVLILGVALGILPAWGAFAAEILATLGILWNARRAAGKAL